MKKIFIRTIKIIICILVLLTIFSVLSEKFHDYKDSNPRYDLDKAAKDSRFEISDYSKDYGFITYKGSWHADISSGGGEVLPNLINVTCYKSDMTCTGSELMYFIGLDIDSQYSKVIRWDKEIIEIVPHKQPLCAEYKTVVNLSNNSVTYFHTFKNLENQSCFLTKDVANLYKDGVKIQYLSDYSCENDTDGDCKLLYSKGKKL